MLPSHRAGPRSALPRAACALALALPLRLSAGSAGALLSPVTPVHAASAAHVPLPLAFEPNLGQAAPSVRFLLHGAGFTLSLSAGELTLVRSAATTEYGPTTTAPRVVRLAMADGATPSRPVGEDRLPGVVNYLAGANPRRWHAGIPTYGEVIYKAVAPGLDLALSVTGDQVRATLRGRGATATPAVAALRRGLAALRLAGLTGADRAAIGATSRLVYATYLGGSGGDVGDGIAVDGQGDAFIIGTTDSANLPTTRGVFQATLRGGGRYESDAFVAKLDPTGSRLLYLTYLSGSGDYGAEGSGIAVDRQGDAYVTGVTQSASFPTTPGAFQTKYSSGFDGFVARLDPTGGRLLYATYLGGSGDNYDRGNAIAVDGRGDAYLTGYTDSTDFPTTRGAFQRKFHGGKGYPDDGDAFVARVATTPLG